MGEKTLINILLCGGSGTRLWPLSRNLLPKQFLKLFNDQSLFMLTCKRNKQFCKKSMIISNEEQYFLALDQLESLGYEEEFLLESVAKNTAAAIALACLCLDKEQIVLVTPSDHLIKDEKEYEKALKIAKSYAQKNALVTFGIKPTHANTGYGYIEANGEDVKKFHEKPDLKTASEYVKEQNYFWNSGMFCFKAGVFLSELEKYDNEIYITCKDALQNSKKTNPLRIKKEYMQKIPAQSIDYAVMEKSKIVKVVPCDIKWNDVGSFDALCEELPNDEQNNLIISENKTIELIDIENTIVVDTNDALLICKKGSSQKIKQVYEKVKKQNEDLVHVHKTAHRPWGSYTVLEDTEKYKIKRIEVKPGCRLSLQKHFHRNEHWIVVSGTATVRVGESVKLVRPNESTYIKMGEIHRLENEGKIPVVLIEAQVGEYTGEDDIVRVEDDFKRC